MTKAAAIKQGTVLTKASALVNILKNKGRLSLEKAGPCYFHEIWHSEPIFNQNSNGNIFKAEK